MYQSYLKDIFLSNNHIVTLNMHIVNVHGEKHRFASFIIIYI